VTGLPRIDVVISTLDEERYVERCLEHVLGQDYPRELVKTILVDGGSTDRTVELARRLGEADDRLDVVADGLRRSLPEAINVAVARGSAELVAKVDAHGYPARDFLRSAADAFERAGEDVACVGGRPEQTGETEWGRAAALARTSRFGVGGSVYAGTTELELVDTVQCGVYRRDALERVGGFDPTMVYGEDDELNWRLRDAGYKILLDASIRFVYVARASPAALFRQYRNYGHAKVRVLLAHPRFLRPWHLAPAALVAGGAALAVGATLGSGPARRAGALAAGAYVAAALVAGTRAAGDGGPARVARVCACFGAIHAGYGAGMLAAGARVAAGKASGKS
jgi:cellulose synthase/poly-beta-1,6-N-acetylglucosamine synthase-like glycosyltransferase